MIYTTDRKEEVFLAYRVAISRHLFREPLQKPWLLFRLFWQQDEKVELMKQRNLGTSGFEYRPKKTRKQIFLEQMNQVIPWSKLVALITPHAVKPGAKK